MEYGNFNHNESVKFGNALGMVSGSYGGKILVDTIYNQTIQVQPDKLQKSDIKLRRKYGNKAGGSVVLA